MPKFSRKSGKGSPAISTASLPDIVFMLLFFFMVTTVMRDQELKVRVNKPDASEIVKLENKALVDYINVGPPMDPRLGTKPRIQLNDQFATTKDIATFIDNARKSRNEAEVKFLTTCLKVDKEVKMGTIIDIKQELREVQAFKINYSTNERERTKN